jgi:pyruvate kinase
MGGLSTPNGGRPASADGRSRRAHATVRHVRRTKIVATIGPASRDPEVLARMAEAGMDVARLNFSHGSREEHEQNVARVRAAASRAGRPVAILQDLPGPKLRIGPLREDLVELRPGDRVTLQCGSDAVGDAQRLSVSWPELCQVVDPEDILYLADGRIRLRVSAVRDGEVDTRVEIGGALASRQGLNIPGSTRGLPAVPHEDLELLRFGESLGVDMVALSFVREPQDVEAVRSHTRMPLIAKIEKPQAVENAVEIIRAADCVMVARGDLGIELPIEDVPVVQKELLRLAGRLARPSITATQMLDSMVISSRPTRAEVTDVANAILDGTDALMLSQETAVGAHPIGAVEMMASIALRIERELPYERWNEERVRRDARDPAYTLAHSACVAARELGLVALIVPTLSGRSARLISAHRPDVPIYALSPGKETVRRCGLIWGVEAASMRRHEVTEELIRDAAQRAVELGWIRRGDRVGITAGLPSGRPGTTSLFQVHVA